MKCFKLAFAMACPPLGAAMITTKAAKMMGKPASTWSCERQSIPTQAPESFWRETTIVDTAAADGSFSTLVRAIQAAGLVATLREEGPFTVFAPNDAAFVKLAAGALDALMTDKEQLTSILTYHVLAGRVMAADLGNLSTATTVNGESLAIRTETDPAMVNNANVIKTDIPCSNGVIHVIDTVLMPALTV